MLERLVEVTDGAVGIVVVLAALAALAGLQASRLWASGGWGATVRRVAGPLSAAAAGLVIARLMVLA
jgi:hypothetical protein